MYIYIRSDQLFSRVQLFATPWITAHPAMAPHSSTLAWRIPWMEEPGRLQSMGSLRVRHDWTTSLSLFTFMHWRRKWQPTPVFLPGESQGQGSLVGCRLWGRTESDTTEATKQLSRPPCTSSTPGVHWDSRPSSQWCHPAISSSVIPFSSCPQSSQHQSLFQWVNSWHEVAKVLEFQL